MQTQFIPEITTEIYGSNQILSDEQLKLPFLTNLTKSVLLNEIVDKSKLLIISDGNSRI